MSTLNISVAGWQVSAELLADESSASGKFSGTKAGDKEEIKSGQLNGEII